jgi:predicted transcriptional regulator
VFPNDWSGFIEPQSFQEQRPHAAGHWRNALDGATAELSYGCTLLSGPTALICNAMEIQLNPDQEARLAELAVRNGRKTDDLIREAVDRFLDDEARFAEAVRLGLAAAENGDFVPSDEVWAGVERALKS